MNALIIWVLLGIFLVAACSNKPEQVDRSDSIEDEDRYQEAWSVRAE